MHFNLPYGMKGKFPYNSINRKTNMNLVVKAMVRPPHKCLLKLYCKPAQLVGWAKNYYT